MKARQLILSLSLITMSLNTYANSVESPYYCEVTVEQTKDNIEEEIAKEFTFLETKNGQNYFGSINIEDFKYHIRLKDHSKGVQYNLSNVSKTRNWLRVVVFRLDQATNNYTQPIDNVERELPVLYDERRVSSKALISGGELRLNLVCQKIYDPEIKYEHNDEVIYLEEIDFNPLNFVPVWFSY
ncbi:MAG: hypothetical protein HON90_04235 [Halobacteriovoraceae bacterium]|jgi:hypothetical protein|nr:hypothetical protein [Halobacteriovoraceae bacterium]